MLYSVDGVACTVVVVVVVVVVLVVVEDSACGGCAILYTLLPLPLAFVLSQLATTWHWQLAPEYGGDTPKSAPRPMMKFPSPAPYTVAACKQSCNVQPDKNGS
jgi:hypothetical protein